jgi:protein-L-isoaspartate(D-aspartate) O-methyltransferase
VADSTSPETLRAQPVARLRARGRITDPVVAAAFARLPRHLFTPPGTSLSAAYADAIVATKRGPDGKTLSSVSAPWLQAHLLAAAGLRPGARVLEVGSGGYHAALIAELVGDEGRVVGVDIDADVVANARTALARAGYPQVHVSGPPPAVWSPISSACWPSGTRSTVPDPGRGSLCIAAAAGCPRWKGCGYSCPAATR